MNIFQERLKALRKEVDLTQDKLAAKLNYSRSTIAQYESGKRIPSNNFLIKVANFFEVSLDYLMGLTNIRLSFQNYLDKYTTSILLFIEPKNGKIIDYSPCALKFYKYSAKEILNKTIFDLSLSSKPDLINALNKAKNSKHSMFYSKNLLANNEIKDVKVTTTTLFIGNKKVIGALIEDITNIKLTNYKNELNNSLIQTISKLHAKKFYYKKYFSQKVADLSYQIGKKLSLSNQNLDLLNKAALLHDIGEIYIPSEIINRPAKLSRTEFKLIETHPETSFEILKDVKFDQKIKEIILQHHERVNGTGYPKGLTGNKILQEAKIIAAADSIIAMISERPFRKAYSKKEALEKMIENRNIKYDSEIVDICVELFESNIFSIIKDEKVRL
jgi:putative nucleotidyltransferase with HDIG domain